MKTCPNCGETNGEANDKCYKCGTDLSQISGENRNENLPKLRRNKR
nr:MAG TPA: PROTEIN/RNA Complex, archaeal, ribosomal, 50S, protein.0A [Caudoviricetes sp.]